MLNMNKNIFKTFPAPTNYFDQVLQTADQAYTARSTSKSKYNFSSSTSNRNSPEDTPILVDIDTQPLPLPQLPPPPPPPPSSSFQINKMLANSNSNPNLIEHPYTASNNKNSKSSNDASLRTLLQKDTGMMELVSKGPPVLEAQRLVSVKLLIFSFHVKDEFVLLICIFLREFSLVEVCYYNVIKRLNFALFLYFVKLENYAESNFRNLFKIHS